MYNLCSANSLTSASLPPLQGFASTSSYQLLQERATPKRSSFSALTPTQQHLMQDDTDRGRPSHHSESQIFKTPQACLLNPFQPSLYDVPTAQLLFFMNLIPQKDREIAHIMRKKEYKEDKRKRKEEEREKKLRKRRKDELTVDTSTPSSSSARKSAGKATTHALSRKKPPTGDEFEQPAEYRAESSITSKPGTRVRRTKTGQKTIDAEWEKQKEIAAAERAQAAKRKRGRDRSTKLGPSDTGSPKPKESSRNRRGRGNRNRGRSKYSAGEADEEGSLFCICRSPDEYGFMIACDKCNDWFHGGCVGLTPVESPRFITSHLSFVAHQPTLTTWPWATLPCRRRGRT